MVAILPQMNTHTCSIIVTFDNMVDIFEEIDDNFGDIFVTVMSTRCEDCSLILQPGVRGKECWPVKTHLFCYK